LPVALTVAYRAALYLLRGWLPIRITTPCFHRFYALLTHTRYDVRCSRCVWFVAGLRAVTRSHVYYHATRLVCICSSHLHTRRYTAGWIGYFVPVVVPLRLKNVTAHAPGCLPRCYGSRSCAVRLGSSYTAPFFTVTRPHTRLPFTHSSRCSSPRLRYWLRGYTHTRLVHAGVRGSTFFKRTVTVQHSWRLPHCRVGRLVYTLADATTLFPFVTLLHTARSLPHTRLHTRLFALTHGWRSTGSILPPYGSELVGSRLRNVHTLPTHTRSLHPRLFPFGAPLRLTYTHTRLHGLVPALATHRRYHGSTTHTHHSLCASALLYRLVTTGSVRLRFVTVAAFYGSRYQHTVTRRYRATIWFNGCAYIRFLLLRPRLHQRCYIPVLTRWLVTAHATRTHTASHAVACRATGWFLVRIYLYGCSTGTPFALVGYTVWFTYTPRSRYHFLRFNTRVYSTRLRCLVYALPAVCAQRVTPPAGCPTVTVLPTFYLPGSRFWFCVSPRWRLQT